MYTLHAGGDDAGAEKKVSKAAAISSKEEQHIQDRAAYRNPKEGLDALAQERKWPQGLCKTHMSTL